MSFSSILFDKEDIPQKTVQSSDTVKDLNLDQIIRAIANQSEEYDLETFFYTPLDNKQLIEFRHAVMNEVAKPSIRSALVAFSEKMILVRRYLNHAQSLYYPNHKKNWFLEAALVYDIAIRGLEQNLQQNELKSKGMKDFLSYLEQHIQLQDFQELSKQANSIKEALSELIYCVNIEYGKFSVKAYEEEINYSTEIIKFFEKFKQESEKKYVFNSVSFGMSHVEAKILDFVARLFPEPFEKLNQFYTQFPNFADKKILRFEREIQFYIMYLNFIDNFKETGLQFCYPSITSDKDEIYCLDGFDLALAKNMQLEDKSVVCNDFSLKEKERIIIVSGPNQGGKTTFARTFGQLHYLASLGCPIPGSKAVLYLFDNIFTHFEREESIVTLSGKLQDELVRFHSILNQMTSRSIVIINEIFTSTSLSDAIYLSKQILEMLSELDVFCIMVTFMDELSTLNEKTVSMVSQVQENSSIRTFKILRKPADGLAYAFSIAKKHGLSYEQIKERIRS